jgi:hypothetical protein
MSAQATAPRGTALELLRMLAALGWVAAAAALSLGLLGALPGWLAGEELDVRRVASVEEAEQRVGARLAVPSYFPSRLGWPPAEVRVAGGRGGAAAFTFRPRSGEGASVQLLQATTQGAAIPPALLATTRELSVTRTTVGPRPAALARVLVDGATWDELRWERDGRSMVLRTQGEVEELLRMARSAHPQGAP